MLAITRKMSRIIPNLTELRSVSTLVRIEDEAPVAAG
jgi:hypothetical protein